MTCRMSGRVRLMTGVALLAIGGPAFAQGTPLGDAELREIVQAQASEIASLRARLDVLERNQEGDHNALVEARNGTVPIAPQLAPAGPATAPVAVARAAAVPVTGAGGRPVDVAVEWGAGAPVFRSGDGVYSFKPRGRILLDAGTTTGSRYDARNITTTGARALRLGIEGGVGAHFFYQFESDFVDNAVDIVTAFIGYRGKVLGHDYDVRAGNLFNERGTDGSTGSDSTPFLERNTVGTSIIPQRGFYGVGIQGRVFGPDWHASLALTGDDIDGTAAVSDSRLVQARAHWNPVKTDDAVAHVAVWGFDEHLSSAAGTITRNSGIGGRFNTNLRVSTGPIVGGTGTTGYGAELGGYVGPVWAMAEAGRRDARLAALPDVTSKAWSVSGGWFLTGERPPYNPRFGNFTQPRVLRSTFDGGPGAIELTARYEELDQTDVTTGGDGNAATLGVNWYLNSFTRLMLNGIRWHTDNRAGAFTGGDTGTTISTRIGASF